jgi:hypothetical protein
MAILKTYFPRKHDIHTYSPEATRDPLVYGEQRGFNSSCQGAAVDFSGVSLRPRGFTQVFDPSQYYNIVFDINSINFWHTSNPCAVLISPKHAIICQHYRGSGRPIGENEVYTFLGKSGTRHSRRAIRVTDFSQQIDHSILEFESDFPIDDVRIYDVIADVLDIPVGHDMWVHDCQSRTYKRSMGVAGYDSSGVRSYSSYPISSTAGLNEGPSLISNPSVTMDPVIWVGDSGSPTFVLTPQGDTILVGLRHAFNEQINEAEITLINKVLLSSSDYSVTHYGFTTGGGGQGGGGSCLGTCFPGDLITFNDPSISSPFKSSLYPYIVETNSEIPSVNLTLQNYQRADKTNRFILSRYSRDSAHTDWYLYYLQSISSTLGKIKKQSETTTRNPIVAVPAIRTHYKKDESQYYPNHYFTP